MGGNNRDREEDKVLRTETDGSVEESFAYENRG